MIPQTGGGTHQKARGRQKLIRFRQPRAIVRPGQGPSYTYYNI